MSSSAPPVAHPAARRKKLVYLVNVPLPTERAHGVQIVHMCDAFAGEGYDVELITPQLADRVATDLFEYHGVPSRFAVRRIPTVAPGVQRPRRVLSHVLFLWRAAQYLKTQTHDALYARELGFAYLPLFFKDYFLEVHALSRRARALHQRKWRRARGIIVVTNPLRDLLRANGVPATSILVAPNGADLELFSAVTSREEARSALGLPRGGSLALYTGHLYGWKGVQTLAEAALHLPPDTTTMFVGGTDEDTAAFRRQYADHRVRVIGHRPYREMPLYLAAADVLVLPNSRRSAESRHYTSPLKLFEYMASGRPIVASDLPSLREVLDEETAALVAPDDPRALAKGISRILEDRGLATRLGLQARQAAQKYTWTARARRINAFLGERGYGSG